MAETKKLLTAFFEPSRSVPMFIIGTAALSLALQAAYDFANDPGHFQGGYWLAIGSLFVAIMILLITAVRQHYAVGQVSMTQEKPPREQMGLLLMTDVAGKNARDAIEYCLPTLKHCWIIATRESLETAQALAAQYQNQIANIYYGELSYLVDPDQIQATYDTAVRIFDTETEAAGLQPDEIVADISGGTKPMTAGMTLACLARDRDMQFMKKPRDASGHVRSGTIAEPIRVDTTFLLSRG